MLEQALRDMRGQLIHEDKTALGKVKGKYAEILDGKGLVNKVYFFLKDNTFYQVMVAGTAQMLTSKDVGKFFNSFYFR